MRKLLFNTLFLFTALLAGAQTPVIVTGEVTKTYGDPPFYLEATSNSNGSFTYSLLSGDAATVTPQGLITINKAGSVIVKVSQAASPPFEEANQNINVVIKKASPNVQITSASKVYIGKTLPLTYTTSPPGAKYAWSIISQTGTSATLDSSALHAGSTTGSLKVKAELVPDDNFEARSASSTIVQQTITVEDSSGIPAITFADINKSYGEYPFHLSASSNSPGTITYNIIEGNDATVTPEGLVTILGAGEVTIELTQAASPPFLATTKRAKLFIRKAGVIGYYTSPNKVYTGDSINLEVTNFPSGANYAFSIVSQSGTNATLNGSKLKVGPTPGSINIKAELIPDENFEAMSASSTNLLQTIEVQSAEGTPTIIFNNLTSTYGNSPFYLTSSSNSPGAITYSIVSGNKATVTPDGLVNILGAGQVVIQLSQEASGTFNAGMKQAVLTIDKASPFATITSSNKVGVNGTLPLTIASYPPGATYTWSIASQSGTNASLNGSILSAGPSTGILNVRAELVADENFEAASASSTFTQAAITVQSTSGVPVITIGNITKQYGDSSFYLNAASTSSGAITYSVLSGDAVTVTSDGLVTIKGVGNVVIQVNQEANGPYEAVTYNSLLRIEGLATGLEENDFTTASIYPNPVKDLLYIKSREKENCSVSAVLYNMEGQIVHSLAGESTSALISINMGEFKTGIYMLKLNYCNSVVYKQIVKQ